jgi:hypothetical protein
MSQNQTGLLYSQIIGSVIESSREKFVDEVILPPSHFVDEVILPPPPNSSRALREDQDDRSL